VRSIPLALSDLRRDPVLGAVTERIGSDPICTRPSRGTRPLRALHFCWRVRLPSGEPAARAGALACVEKSEFLFDRSYLARATPLRGAGRWHMPGASFFAPPASRPPTRERCHLRRTQQYPISNIMAALRGGHPGQRNRCLSKPLWMAGSGPAMTWECHPGQAMQCIAQSRDPGAKTSTSAARVL
jgi:hypothetical protein